MFFSLSKNTRNRKRKAPIFIHKLFQKLHFGNQKHVKCTD